MTQGTREDTLARAPIPVVVQQHVEEAAHLRNVRSTLAHAPHVRLRHLERLDERIAAHLDGIAVAGEYGAALSRRALDPPGTGSVFTATVLAIESRDPARLQHVLALSADAAQSRRGLLSAFGWVSGASLRGITKTLLDANEPWWREVGLAACAMHRVDPGAALLQRAIDLENHPALTSRALHAATALGLVGFRDACVDRVRTSAEPIAFAAACAATLLGDRTAAVDVLRSRTSAPGAERDAALALWLKLAPHDEVRELLKALHGKPGAISTLIRAIGVVGDSSYIPWLIARMDDLALTRLAGESFSLITGLDLSYLDLDRKPPENARSGPNDDPDDDDVAMDEDDGLPWPDQDKATDWWKANGSRFAPGTRYFMGHPPTTAHCLSVLQTGFQRQRRHAAEHLCLLQPGTPLFNTAAPAWRQQRLLAQMVDS